MADQSTEHSPLSHNQENSAAPLSREQKISQAEKKAAVSGRERFLQILKVFHKYHVSKGMTPEKMRLILEDLGPTYVKIGQIMSSRHDIMPQE